MPTPRPIYGAPSSAGSCAAYCNETDALAALETMIGLLEDVVKYYPPALFTSRRMGSMSIEYTGIVLPPIYFRLLWKNTYKMMFDFSAVHTYQLLDLYVAAGADWNADPMLAKLIVFYKIDAPVFPYGSP